MKVASAKFVDRQRLIFDPDPLLLSTGAARSWVGDFFEELTASITGATRLKTDSNADICPDLRFAADTFFECKGVGRSGQAIMYQRRFEKDRRFIDQNTANVFYWFWRHKAAVLESETIGDLRTALAASVYTVAVISRRTLEEIISTRPLRRINSKYTTAGKRNGYGSDNYGTGWTIPLSRIFEKCAAVGSVGGFAFGKAARFAAFADVFTPAEIWRAA